MQDNNLLYSVVQFHAVYAKAVDQSDWNTWVDLFVDDCCYKIQPRENFDRHLPLCTLALLSKGMLRDRVYGITNTLYHDPYYQRHIIGMPLIVKVDTNHIHCETNYSVFRTKYNEATEIMNVGRYIDNLVVMDGEIKIQSRICVFDTEMIPNSLIYPI
jgi:salicylate 5-hydroxylase small subunit